MAYAHGILIGNDAAGISTCLQSLCRDELRTLVQRLSRRQMGQVDSSETGLLQQYCHHAQELLDKVLHMQTQATISEGPTAVGTVAHELFHLRKNLYYVDKVSQEVNKELNLKKSPVSQLVEGTKISHKYNFPEQMENLVQLIDVLLVERDKLLELAEATSGNGQQAGNYSKSTASLNKSKRVFETVLSELSSRCVTMDTKNSETETKYHRGDVRHQQRTDQEETRMKERMIDMEIAIINKNVEIKDLQESLRQYAGEFKWYKDNLQKLKSDNDQYQESLRQKDEEIYHLRSITAKSEESNQKLSETIHSMQEQSLELQGENISLTHLKDQTETDAFQKDERIRELEAHTQDLMKELSYSREQCNDKDRHVETLEHEVGELQKSIAEQESERLNLAEDLKKAQEEVKRLENFVTTKEERIQDLGNQLESARSQLVVFEELVQESGNGATNDGDGDHDRISEENKSPEDYVYTRTEFIKDLQSQLDASRRQIEILEDHLHKESEVDSVAESSHHDRKEESGGNIHVRFASNKQNFIQGLGSQLGVARRHIEVLEDLLLKAQTPNQETSRKRDMHTRNSVDSEEAERVRVAELEQRYSLETKQHEQTKQSVKYLESENEVLAKKLQQENANFRACQEILNTVKEKYEMQKKRVMEIVHGSQSGCPSNILSASFHEKSSKEEHTENGLHNETHTNNKIVTDVQNTSSTFRTGDLMDEQQILEESFLSCQSWLTEAEAELNRSKLQVEESQTKCKEYQEQLESSRIELEKWNTKCRQLQNQSAQTKTQLEQYSLLNEDLRNFLARKGRNNERLESIIEQLKKELDYTNRRLDDYSRNEAEQSELKKSYSDLEKRLNETQKHLDAAVSARTHTEQQLKNAHERLEEEITNRNHDESEVSTLYNDYLELQEKLKETKEELEKESSNRKLRETELERVQKTHSDLHKEIEARLEEEVYNRNLRENELERLQHDYSELQTQLQGLEEQLDIVRAEPKLEASELDRGNSGGMEDGQHNQLDYGESNLGGGFSNHGNELEHLRERYYELDHQLAETEQELEDTRCTLDSREEEYKQLQDRYSDAEEQLNNTLNKQLEKEWTNREEDRKEVERLYKIYSELQNQYKQTVKQMHEEISDRKLRERELEEAQVKYSELEKRLQHAEERLDEETYNRNLLEDNLEKQETESSEMETKVRELEDQLAEEASQRTSLESELQTTQKNHADLQEKLVRYEKELKEESSGRTRLEHELDRLRTDYFEVEQQLQSTFEEMQEQVANRDAREHELESLRSSYSQLEHQVRQLETQLDKEVCARSVYETELESLREQNDQISTREESLRYEIGKLKLQLKRKDAEIIKSEGIKSQAQMVAEDFRGFLLRYTEYRKLLDTYSEEMHSANALRYDLENYFGTIGESILLSFGEEFFQSDEPMSFAKVMAAVDSIISELVQKRQKENELENSLYSLQSEVENLSSDKKEEVQTISRQAKEEKAQLKQEADSLRDQLQQERASKRELNAKVQELEKLTQNLKNDYRREKQISSESVETTCSELKRLQRQLDERDTAVRERGELLRRKDLKIYRLQAEADEMDAKVKEEQRRVAELQLQNQDLEEKIEEMEEFAYERSRQLHGQIEASYREKEGTLEYSNSLKKKLDQVTLFLHDTFSSNTQLATENERLLGRIKELEICGSPHLQRDSRKCAHSITDATEASSSENHPLERQQLLAMLCSTRKSLAEQKNKELLLEDKLRSVNKRTAKLRVEREKMLQELDESRRYVRQLSSQRDFSMVDAQFHDKNIQTEEDDNARRNDVRYHQGNLLNKYSLERSHHHLRQQQESDSTCNNLQGHNVHEECEHEKEKLKSEIDEFQKQAEKLHEDNSRLRVELDETYKRLAYAEKSKQDLANRLSSLEKHLSLTEDKLQKIMSHADYDITSWRLQIREITTEKEHLEKQLNEKEGINSRKGSELASLQEKFDNLFSKYQELEKENTRLRELNNVYRDRIQKLSQHFNAHVAKQHSEDKTADDPGNSDDLNKLLSSHLEGVKGDFKVFTRYRLTGLHFVVTKPYIRKMSYGLKMAQVITDQNISHWCSARRHFYDEHLLWLIIRLSGCDPSILRWNEQPRPDPGIHINNRNVNCYSAAVFCQHLREAPNLLTGAILKGIARSYIVSLVLARASVRCTMVVESSKVS